jgi:hypothetical protein
MAEGVPMTNDTSTTGSRLPAEVPWSGAQSGLGLKPDLEAVAGLSEIPGIYDRPAKAQGFDAQFDDGLIAEGRMDGEVDTERDIPWI